MFYKLANKSIKHTENNKNWDFDKKQFTKILLFIFLFKVDWELNQETTKLNLFKQKQLKQFL